MIPLVRNGPARRLVVLLGVALPGVIAATTSESTATSAHAAWKINTHLFAANVARADVITDGMVTIPPFGEFPVNPAVVRALREAPAAYRAGVIGPDLFPDMYVGGWLIHSDLSKTEGWTADDWLRRVWTKALAWPNGNERDKVLAFGYGFLTHGAGDIFAHTWVNEKADGAWVSFTGKDRSTAFKHILLEGFVGEHTPPTDVSIDVWPRFVANELIKDDLVRRHSGIAKHYRTFLSIADGLPKAIARAKSQMNNNVDNDAPYWVKCTINPLPCARKEHAETWLLDINRGFRAIVDSSESLGEMLMDGAPLDGAGAMTGWATEWVPKMFGAHALGEGTAALSEFMQWAGDLVPISEIIKAEVERFVRDSFPEVWRLYQAAQHPSTYMEQPGLFPPGTKDKVRAEMGVRPGASHFDWRAFAPIYNSIILSKLILLDATALNELLRRAGVSSALFPVAPSTNIMLGVFKSMTQSYQWVGDSVDADTGAAATKFGVCGPETGALLPSHTICGVEQRHVSGRLAGTQSVRSLGGFVLWGDSTAREKVFRVIFKGFGPGPGSADRQIVAYAPVAVAGLRETRRALRSAVDQTEYLREVVALMRDKVGGVLRTAPSTTAGGGRGRPSSGVSPAAVSDWGARCCARDIARARDALAALELTTPRLTNAAALQQLGRRASTTQLSARTAQIRSALDAFTKTSDAAAASAALSSIAQQIESLTAIVAGTQ